MVVNEQEGAMLFALRVPPDCTTAAVSSSRSLKPVPVLSLSLNIRSSVNGRLPDATGGSCMLYSVPAVVGKMIEENLYLLSRVHSEKLISSRPRTKPGHSRPLITLLL